MGQSGLGNSFRAYGRGDHATETAEQEGRSDSEESPGTGQDSDSETIVRPNTDTVLDTFETVDTSGRTLRYLYPAYFEVDAKAQIPLFEDETGITIVDEQTPAHATGTRQVYADLFDSDNTPFDVGQMDVIWPAKFAAAGWSSPIVDRAGHTDEMLETQVDTMTVDGDLQAMPIHTDVNVLYYRQDKLEEYGYASPPETDSELVAIAQDILERDEEIEHGFIWQGGENEGLTIMWLNWMWGRGGQLFDGDDIVIDTQAGIDALRHAVNLIHVHDVSPAFVANSSTDENRRTFQTGNTLFMRNWPYAVSRFEDGTPVIGKFGVTTLPTHEDHTGVANACLGGWNLFVNPSTENKVAAQEFVEWMASEPVQRRLAIDHSRLPVRKDLYSDPAVRDEFPILDVFEDALERARSRPTIRAYPRFTEIIFTECNAALRQEKTPAAALSDAQVKIDDEINAQGAGRGTGL